MQQPHMDKHSNVTRIDRNQRIVAAILAICLLLSLGYWYTQRMQDPKSVAIAGLNAVLDGKLGNVWDNSAEKLFGNTDLDERKLKLVYDEFVLPVLMPIRASASEPIGENLNDPPTQGIAEAKVRLASGAITTFAYDTWMTEAGPKHAALWGALSQVWILRHANRNPGGPRADLAVAKLAGLKEDRAKLESIGLKGVLCPNGIFYTWDQLEKRWESEVQK